MYLITGKFVTTLVYNEQQLLQGDFVIDGDPSSHSIPVVMTRKTGNINVIRTQEKLDGTNAVKPEDTESFRQSIIVNAQIQLRIYSLASEKSANDKIEEKVLDGMIAGNWSIPDDFIIDPPMIVVLK